MSFPSHQTEAGKHTHAPLSSATIAPTFNSHNPVSLGIGGNSSTVTNTLNKLNGTDIMGSGPILQNELHLPSLPLSTHSLTHGNTHTPALSHHHPPGQHAHSHGGGGGGCSGHGHGHHHETGAHGHAHAHADAHAHAHGQSSHSSHSSHSNHSNHGDHSNHGGHGHSHGHGQGACSHSHGGGGGSHSHGASSAGHSSHSSHSGTEHYNNSHSGVNKRAATDSKHTHGHGHGQSQTAIPIQSYDGETSSNGKSKGLKSSLGRLRLSSRWRQFRQLVLSDVDARKLFLFIVLKSLFVFVQFGYGFNKKNLSVISAGFHTSLDCSALGFSLFAMIMSKREAPTEYSYGWGRLEVMSAFTNACFLIFVCVFTIIETFHTLYKPGDIHSDSLVMASCGLAVNAIGIALFCKYATLSSTSDVISPHQLTLQVQRYRNSGSTQDGSIVDRSRFNNLHSVYLHVFADILSHSGLLLAAWIINAKGWLLAHPVLVIGISLVVMRSAYPLFDMARMVLLQTVDPALQQGLQRCIREISFRDGVLECRSAHWWSNAPGVTVGSLHIRVRTDADEQDILLYAHGLLKKYVMHITVQIEKDRPVTWLMK